jgi:hypothetical protein
MHARKNPILVSILALSLLVLAWMHRYEYYTGSGVRLVRVDRITGEAKVLQNYQETAGDAPQPFWITVKDRPPDGVEIPSSNLNHGNPKDRIDKYLNNLPEP